MEVCTGRYAMYSTLCLQAVVPHAPALPMCNNLEQLPNVETRIYLFPSVSELSRFHCEMDFSVKLMMFWDSEATFPAELRHFKPACILLPMVFRLTMLCIASV